MILLRLLILVLLSIQTTHATNHLEKLSSICDEAMRTNSPTFLSRKTISKQDDLFRIVAQNIRGYSSVYFFFKEVQASPIHIFISDYIIDFVRVDSSLYVLTFEGLREYDFSSGILLGEYPTYELKTKSFNKYELPTALAFGNGKLYITHGELGLSSFNIETRNLDSQVDFKIEQDHGQRSWATGIAFYNDQLYVAFDNITYDYNSKKRAFEGIVVFDDELNTVFKRRLNQAREAYHEPYLSIDKSHLIMRNLDLNFIFTFKSIFQTKGLRPLKRIYNYDGHRPLGILSYKSKRIEGCFINSSNKGFFTQFGY